MLVRIGGSLIKPVLALCVLSHCLVALAQVQKVDEPPPPITFSDWKEVPAEEGTSEYNLSFPSAVQTQFPENDTVPIRVIMPSEREGPLPVVVVLHYWGATDQRNEEELARELNQRKIAAVLMALPYHLSRTPHGYRSGQLAVTPDTSAMIETMVQSVLDVRRTVDFIDSRPEFDHSHIGISGISLGSLVAILSYAVEPRFQAGVFMLGGIDIAHIIWHSSRVVYVREALRRRGYTEARLRAELAPIEAKDYLAARKGGNAFVIGGKYDTVIPPTDTEKLIAALPGCKVLWLDTGHYGGVFVVKRVLRTAADFLAKELSGQNFVPPLRLYAPTLRIGALADYTDGFQIGAGVDLFRAGPKRQFFSSIIATPKGLNLFAGFGLGQGFAIGGFATPAHLSLGVWWSVVL